ncbi:Hypothetical predicted protein [Pelobates cultripes]|uniref:Uncharacterized protein n=1 Tax=Pelobates cultripes TaxID=61616 RepID=A0AAD1R971_PELCU|nr:Hypothetical predicted protein [Pelobates cultripes]
MLQRPPQHKSPISSEELQSEAKAKPQRQKAEAAPASRITMSLTEDASDSTPTTKGDLKILLTNIHKLLEADSAKLKLS